MQEVNVQVAVRVSLKLLPSVDSLLVPVWIVTVLATVVPTVPANSTLVQLIACSDTCLI